MCLASSSMVRESQAKTLCLFCIGLHHMKLPRFDCNWLIKMAISYGLTNDYLFVFRSFPTEHKLLEIRSISGISHPYHQLLWLMPSGPSINVK